MSTYDKLKKWKEDLYKENPPSDGFDMTYYMGIDVIIKEFEGGDGEADGGITENYFSGIQDALNKIKEKG